MNDFLHEMKKACSYGLNFKCKKYIEYTDNEDFDFKNAEIKFYITIYGTEFESNYYYTDSYSTYEDKIEVVDLFITDLNKAIYDFNHGIAFKLNEMLVFEKIINEMEQYKKTLLHDKLQTELVIKNSKTKVNKI